MGLRQGHILTAAELGIEGSNVSYALISQTCDIVLAKRPTLTVAPVTELDGQELLQAKKRDNPRFIALPELGNTAFVDLSHIESILKSETESSFLPVDGIDLVSDVARRDFALAVGRWFSRFAFPDEVVPWLRPVLAVIRQKHDRPESALGQLLNRVVEFRVEAADWSERPLDLILHMVVPAGAVPQLEEPPENPTLIARLRDADGNVRAPTAIAEILQSLTEPEDLVLGWGALAESLGAICYPKDTEMTEQVKGAVRAVTGMLASDDEFSLANVRRSEILDLDYLSAPTPFG